MSAALPLAKRRGSASPPDKINFRGFAAASRSHLVGAATTINARTLSRNGGGAASHDRGDTASGEAA
ncbi:MAG TPA: hypothetical protein VHL50_08085 [Pyrinomonadaceae bacterium]|nr:hypothetical protein [Pyrinomonadaceae bacterium]